MPDPIRIEEAFQETTESIETAQSFRYIFSRFFAFTSLLEGEYLKYQSYLHQLVEALPLYTLPVTWSGLNPEKLQNNAELLEDIATEIKTDTCSEVIRRLREVSFLQFICLCEPEKADLQFGSLTGSRLLEGKAEHVKGTTCSNLIYVQQAIRRYSERSGLSQFTRQTVERLLTDIRRMLQRDGNSMLIPVVEDSPPSVHSNDFLRFGRLRKMRLRDAGRNSKKDVIIRHYPVSGAEPVSNLEHPAITSWGRKKAEEKYPGLKDLFLNASLHYDINEASHQGESGSMAISAMWYTFLLEKAELRERYTLAGDAAMTGDVDENGVVLPVDPDGIAYKTEAAFFSWANLLAIPAQQFQEFEKCLNKLKKRYPDRHLTLIGVEHLDGIFYDRRLSEYVVESRLKHSFKKFRKEKFKVVGIPVIVILLLVIARLAYGPIDRNPVVAEYEGEHMLLMNENGQIITKIDVGASLVQDIQRSQNPRVPSKSNFYDIDDDGINEVFYTRSLFNQNQSGYEELIAYSLTGDSIIWEKDLTFDFKFPNKPDVAESGYKLTSINISEKNGEPDHISVIANLAHVKFFPGLILKLNAHEGTETARYIHTGRIRQTETVDIDGDGIVEVVGLGQNNAFGESTVLFAMELDQLNGRSPSTEAYKVTGYQQVEHIHYVEIPQTIVGNVFRRRIMNNNPEHLIINGEEKLLRVRVYDFFLPENDPFKVNYGALIYMFDYDFNIKSIGTSSYYDLWVKNLYEDGLIPFKPDQDYFQSFKDSIMYWNGKKFLNRKEYFSQQTE